MKLSEGHIHQIEALLRPAGLFYGDIRDEVVDHIATTLEEDPGLTPGNFEEKLHSYYNSHRWVKLLTAAQQQEKIRDGQYKSYFLHQFLTLNGIGIYSITLAAVYLAELNSYTEKATQLLFILLVLAAWTGAFKKRWPFARRMVELLGLYYAPLLLLCTQLKRFFDEEAPALVAIRLAATALIFAGHIMLYKTNRLYKTHRYA